MTAGSKDRDETYSEEETARRRDEVVRRMLNTPPQPRKAKADKPARKPKAAKSRSGKKLSRSNRL
jgi:hypothetical protein